MVRHNEIRDITANLLTEVCHDVQIEPCLQPLTGESLAGASSNTSDGARLDIAVNGFWGGHFERTYLDVRVFNPLAVSNRSTSINSCYRKHEDEKKRAYECPYADCQVGGFCPTRGGTYYMYYVYTVNECDSHRLSWYVSAYTTKQLYVDTPLKSDL